MKDIVIEIRGVAVELVLGNYMPTDATIMNDWSDFYHYNDLIHHSRMMADYIKSVTIKSKDKILYQGEMPFNQVKNQKSFLPIMLERALYLRTECVEESVYTCSIAVKNFNMEKLVFETQDYDLLFVTSKRFLACITYEDTTYELDWSEGKPIGNVCVLCRYENGYLNPLYDAINKIEKKK